MKPHGLKDDPGRWDRGIDLLQRSGGGTHIPLLEAGKAGLLDLVFVGQRHCSVPLGRMRKSARPVLALVGDDDEQSSGPDGWRSARQLTRWAAGAIVHGAGAERQHYEEAVRGALICQRFVIVDTSSRHALAWADLLAHARLLVVLPANGQHPAAAQKGTVH